LFSCDGTGVILWDLQTGEKLRTYPQGWLFALSPNGKTLALFGRIHEIHLVDVASGKTLHTVDCGKDWIRCAAFSADSETLFSGGDHQIIREWQVSSGKAVRQFKKATGSVSWLSPSADGKTCLCLASVLPSTVQLFDAAAGKPQRSLGNVLAVAATPDGKTVVASRGGDIIVWDPATGKIRQRFHANDGGANDGDIRVLAISPDGNTVALAGYDDEFRIFDISSGKETRLLPELRGPVYALAFSADGTTLAAAGWGGVIRLWRWRAGKELYDGGHRDAVVSLTFSPDGKMLISRGLDYTVRVWDLAAGQEIGRVSSHEGGKQIREPFSMLHALDNQSLLRSVVGGLAILDWKTGKYRPLETPIQGTPAAVAPDGKRLLTYQLQGSAAERTAVVIYTLWDLTRGEKIRDFTHSFKDAPAIANAGAWPEAVAIAADGKTIATSWSYRRHGPMYTMIVGHGVSLWDVATGKERRLASAAFAYLAFLDGGKTLVCAHGNGKSLGVADERDKGVMEFWDVATGKKFREFEGPAEWGGVLTFSPDGRFFASAGGDDLAVVYLWRTASGTLVKQFAGHRQRIECLTFSPDGRMLASGSSDTTVLVWEVFGL
jgi:WD40 repeat protein